MTKEVISLPDTPQYPFSPGIRAGDYIFVSGQGGFVDPEGREVIGVEAQTRQCLENMKRVLEAGGSSLSEVVKVTVFLGDSNAFAEMNKVYQEYFPNNHPSRSTAITGLAIPNMLIEMDCVAYSKGSSAG